MSFGDSMKRTILHADMNNFYASVECLYDPAIRNQPVAVCGSIENRHGIVLAKNNLAKKFGIKTGDVIWQAKQKCPKLVVVSPNYDRYLQFSQVAREIYLDYTDQVESFGLDECWLDVSGSTHMFGTGQKIADEIRARIKAELGVTASVGVSWNKIFAKLGSDMKKPDATTVITPQNYKHKVWPLAVTELLYVGRSTGKTLYKYGIKTIGELANTENTILKKILGINGVKLWAFANGLDNSPVTNVDTKPIIKSVGNSTTTPRDLTSDDDVKIVLYMLCESVAERLRELQTQCATVQISIRDYTLFAYERQQKLVYPTNLSDELFAAAFSLYQQHHVTGQAIRSLGVRACQLTPASIYTAYSFPKRKDYKTK